LQSKGDVCLDLARRPLGLTKVNQVIAEKTSKAIRVQEGYIAFVGRGDDV